MASSLIQYLDSIQIENNDENELKSDFSKMECDQTEKVSVIVGTTITNIVNEQRIWDNWKELSTIEKDGKESFSFPVIGDATNKRSKGTLQALKISLSEKIDDMRHELCERCTEANLLYSKLNITKEQNEQSLVKTKDKWERRLNDQCSEHDELLSEKQIFSKQLNEDTRRILQKMHIVNAEIEKMQKKNQNACHQMFIQYEKNLERLRKVYQNSEKRKIQKLVESKTSALKEEAAKALEPEMQQILLQHKNEVSDLRSHLDADLKVFENNQRFNHDQKLLKETNKMEEESRIKLQEVKKEHDTDISNLISNHEKEVQNIREQFNKTLAVERDSFEIESKKRRDELSTEIENIQKSENLKLKEASNKKESELTHFKGQQESILNYKKIDIQKKSEQFRSIKLKDMKKESAENLCRQLKSLQNQMRGAIEMVTQKLDIEKDETKLKIQVEVEKKKQKMKEEETKKLECVIEREKEIQTKYENAIEKIKTEKEEHVSLASLINVKRKELQEMIQEQHNVQSCLEDLDFEHENRKKNNFLKSKREVSFVQNQLHELKMHLEAKHTQEKKLEEEQSLILVKVREEHEYQNQVTQDKIREVLMNLELRMLSDRESLEDKISERKRLSNNIDENRKQHILQGSS